MHKLKTFLRRVKSMSFQRMGMYADKARADANNPKWIILLDMLWCIFRYGVGYLDYLTFGFVHLRAKQRKTYMTMNDNLRLVRTLNASSHKDRLFEDKLGFIELFSEYANRDWLDLHKATADDLAAFGKKHPVFFAKEADNFGGHGVTRERVDEHTDFAALHAQLTENRQYLIEQEVVQHIEMNRLCQKSVNTIRVVTLAKDGDVHFMYALVRMGSGESHVDNISSGGMYAPVHDGKITAPAFCDKTGEYYDVHPATGTKLVGFEIPMFDEAIAMVKRAATVVPEVRYVGWDVAISKDGPVIIEGNTIPSYDMCQNYRHLGAEKIGVKPRFLDVLGDEFYGK